MKIIRYFFRFTNSREGRFLSAHLDLLSAASSLFPSLSSRRVDYDEEDLLDTGSSIVSYSKADKLVASKSDLSESDTIRGKYLDLMSPFRYIIN